MTKKFRQSVHSANSDWAKRRGLDMIPIFMLNIWTLVKHVPWIKGVIKSTLPRTVNMAVASRNPKWPANARFELHIHLNTSLFRSLGTNREYIMRCQSPLFQMRCAVTFRDITDLTVLLNLIYLAIRVTESSVQAQNLLCLVFCLSIFILLRQRHNVPFSIIFDFPSALCK
jgi:hypothetical protein